MDLYNDSHEKVCILSGIKETCITSTLKTGDKEITFEFRKTNRYAADIKEEGYIRTDTDEFVIKQVEPSGEWYKCNGTLNVEELEGKQYPQGFETVEKTVDECLTEAIDGTGWKVIRCDVSKKRTIRIEQNCSAWDVAQQAITTYRCEMVFDSLNKGISVYEKCGEDRGAYFIERLNLKRLQVQSNSYDFATRLIPIQRGVQSAAYQRSVSCESSSSVQLNRCGVHKHRTDTVRNIRRLLFKNGNGIRHRKNPDRCIRK